MAEKIYYQVNCNALENLVDKLHYDTTFADLEPEEITRIFGPPPTFRSRKKAGF